MAKHTVELSETTYQLLLAQAHRLKLPPTQVLEQLMIGDLALPPAMTEAQAPAQIADAVAAVERLGQLFADIPLANVDQHLDNPMLGLANADIETAIR